MAVDAQANMRSNPAMQQAFQPQQQQEQQQGSASSPSATGAGAGKL